MRSRWNNEYKDVTEKLLEAEVVVEVEVNPGG